jgi:hypothetical protein
MAPILQEQGIPMELAQIQSTDLQSEDIETHFHRVDNKAQSPHIPGASTGGTLRRLLSAAEQPNRGHVLLDNLILRHLRQARCMSQQDLADDCWRRNIQLSLTTIKRAEAGRPVRFRIAREFARCLGVLVTQIVRQVDPEASGHR